MITEARRDGCKVPEGYSFFVFPHDLVIHYFTRASEGGGSKPLSGLISSRKENLGATLPKCPVSGLSSFQCIIFFNILRLPVKESCRLYSNKNNNFVCLPSSIS